MEPDDVRIAVVIALSVAERWERDKGGDGELFKRDNKFLKDLLTRAKAREADDVVARESKSLVRPRHSVAIHMVDALVPVLTPYRRKLKQDQAEGLINDVAEVIAAAKADAGLYAESGREHSVNAAQEAQQFTHWVELTHKRGLVAKDREATVTPRVKANLLQLFLDDSGPTKSGLDGAKGAAIRIAAWATGNQDSPATLRKIIGYASRSPNLSGRPKDIASRLVSRRPDSAINAFVNLGRVPSTSWLLQYILRVLLELPDHRARRIVLGALRNSGPWPRLQSTVEEGVARPPGAALLGNRIKAMREANGATVDELDFAVGIGTQVIEDIEAGIVDATVSEVFALASAFGTTAASLLEQHEEGQLEALVARAREVVLFGAAAGLRELATADEEQDT